MTGYGAARRHQDDLLISVEIRTVNNRYLKVVTRCPESCGPLENRIERVLRDAIQRGTVTTTVRLQSEGGAGRYAPDADVLADYCRQLEDVAQRLGVPSGIELVPLLNLPGAIRDESAEERDLDVLWELVGATLEEALTQLQHFREQEGQNTAVDLRQQSDVVAGELEVIAQRAPVVVAEYRDRLAERVNDLLHGTAASVSPEDLIREVSLFAERCDVNEELSRMQSHLGQFRETLEAQTSQGRKLEFLSQEMFREVNTIGSKANDVEIAHRIVEVKAAIDRIRENLQNVE